MPEPKRPTRISPLGEACLEALAASGTGRFVSLGGAFALMHYHEYRDTNDIDAWWSEDAGQVERDAVVGVLCTAMERDGPVRVRRFGDVVSIELMRGARKAFSFQIARRSARLEDSVPSSWAGVQIDAFEDVLASKVTALVERGAPRDFRDVHAVCQAGLADPEGLWSLWSRRQSAGGGDPDRKRAELLVSKHLETIARLRPLESIADRADRGRAEQLRTWIVREFLHDLRD